MEEIKKKDSNHNITHLHHAKINKHSHQKENIITKPILGLVIAAFFLILFNQYQINSVYGLTTSGSSFFYSGSSSSSGDNDLSNINLHEISSTAQTIAAVYSLEGLDGDSVMKTMFPTGTPDYGEALGVSFDDPITSLDVLAKMYRGLKVEVESNDPEAFARFINLASNPYGVSCEYCCGIGPTGSDKKGNSRCGCSHNPGILSLALYLSAYTDYNDGEILRESMRWKTLWFPKNMIELGASIAGGDTSVLENLPGMVGGC